MGTPRTIHSDLHYVKQLAAAGWKGVAATRHEMPAGVFAPPLAFPTALSVGAAIGLLGTGATARRRKASSMALGGVVGSLVGLGAVTAWASRHFTRAASRAAIRRVNAARDAHWLELNPIDYA
jgi:hypothetical protein